MKIIFSNAIKHNQDHFDFLANDTNKYVHGTKYMHSDEDYLEIIRKSIPHRLETINYKDLALKTEEALALNKALENQIEYWLSLRTYIPINKGTDTVTYKGNTIELDIRPVDINNNDKALRDLLRLHDIIEECLEGKKPLYLSIYEEK